MLTRASSMKHSVVLVMLQGRSCIIYVNYPSSLKISTVIGCMYGAQCYLSSLIHCGTENEKELTWNRHLNETSSMQSAQNTEFGTI
jgi:hypothetical protein